LHRSEDLFDLAAALGISGPISGSLFRFAITILRDPPEMSVDAH
jgi:hypothetical protein